MKEILGPIQEADKQFIRGLVKMIRPKVVLEFGLFIGGSAGVFLEEIGPDDRLYSYDTGHEDVASKLSQDPRFHFIKESQNRFNPAQIGYNKVDLVLIDASHDLALNQETFNRILPVLHRGSVVLVHDTGNWAKKFHDVDGGRLFPNGEYCHRPQEREFVNWIKEQHPDFSQIHLHTLREMRHGMTVLQFYSPLEIPPR